MKYKELGGVWLGEALWQLVQKPYQEEERRLQSVLSDAEVVRERFASLGVKVISELDYHIYGLPGGPHLTTGILSADSSIHISFHGTRMLLTPVLAPTIPKGYHHIKDKEWLRVFSSQMGIVAREIDLGEQVVELPIPAWLHARSKIQTVFVTEREGRECVAAFERLLVSTLTKLSAPR